MMQNRKLQAARDRRDAGKRPLPGDNLLLLAAREPHNPRSLPVPTEPKSGSRQARVLEMLRCWESVTIEELARLTDSRPFQVRGAIDALRKKAHYIRRVESQTFTLRHVERLAAV
ncbi:MAG: hypothetical protein CMJ84_16080 [Planctomycetes bacterium]|jgi:hypothetical protein|nr:hypothetical protein [Planctomycetota bacterium]MDP6407904.1 DUF3489 domain-containing protein [Planctomycetota bacterium]